MGTGGNKQRGAYCYDKKYPQIKPYREPGEIFLKSESLPAFLSWANASSQLVSTMLQQSSQSVLGIKAQH